MTFARPCTPSADICPLVKIESLHMDVGDHITVYALGKEFTLAVHTDKRCTVLSLSQTLPQYTYAHPYMADDTTRTERHGFVLEESEDISSIMKGGDDHVEA